MSGNEGKREREINKRGGGEERGQVERVGEREVGVKLIDIRREGEGESMEKGVSYAYALSHVQETKPHLLTSLV